MANRNQHNKKSPTTKASNAKQKGKGTREQATLKNEEKTAVTAHSVVKKVSMKKAASRASVNTEKKKSMTEMATACGLRKSRSTMSVDKTIDKTIDDEKKSTTPKKKKEKWAGEEAANSFTRRMLNANLQSDYDELAKIPAQVERCKIWQANSGRNRHPDYKCYDDSRLIVQLCKNDYINGSKVNVPNFSPMIYLVQLPKLDIVDAVEEFWRMVFQDQCQTVHIIARPEEVQNPGIEKLFAQESGAYLYANGFFINTRKVERNTKKKDTKADMFVVELLPEGCSNSVMCSVYLHTYWKPFSGPDRFCAQMRAAQQIAKNEGGSNSPTVIVSVRGAGRNSALLALAVAVDQLSRGKEPKIRDIVHTIREQRPMSVDSWPMYVSLYLAINWLIKAMAPKMTPGSTTDEILSRIKKFHEKATQIMPPSMMKPPTEGITIE